MATAIVSDLHLGAASGRDLLRHEAVLGPLLDALGGVDHLVLLGDVVELREAPVAEMMDSAAPVLARIGRAMEGRRVTVVPGNHDHQLSGRLRGWVGQALGGPEVRVAYPGVWLREDVYATHGHYLDVHNTVPSFERLAIAAAERAGGRVPRHDAAPGDYERVVRPVYELAYRMAQSPRGRRLLRPGTSARAWERLGDPSPAAAAAVRATVALLNAAGLGPLSADLSGAELRRAALRGMCEALRRLGIEAPHVVFGHTHRSGPHERDEGWDGLVNAGSWILEPRFLGERPRESPYWPGHCVLLDDEGPPRLRRLVDELPELDPH